MARPTVAILLLLSAPAVWPWGNEGHETVARIAAAHLSERSQQAVADLLRQDADLGRFSTGDGVADMMARAATWPDHMPGGKGATAAWHYVDIGLFESPSNLAARCPQGNCIVAKIHQYLANLPRHRGDGAWPEYKELEFLLHFVGDIHQPLHCATNGDAGGNCVRVAGFGALRNLHAVWDIALVRRLMARDGRGLISGMEERYRSKARRWRDYGSIENIAAESFRIATSRVYRVARPRIPVLPVFVDVQPRYCATEAPETVRSVLVDGPRSYGGTSLDLVRAQLYRAGVRLAAMLNQIYE